MNDPTKMRARPSPKSSAEGGVGELPDCPGSVLVGGIGEWLRAGAAVGLGVTTGLTVGFRATAGFTVDLTVG